MALPRWPIPAEGFEPTQWSMPRTGDTKIRPQYRNGYIDRNVYRSDALVWRDRGYAFDIVAVALAETAIPLLPE